MQQGEETESVEGCMITAQVSCSLLVDTSMMHLIIRKVGVRNKLNKGFWRDRRRCSTDVRQCFLEDVIPKVAHLFGHDGYLDSMHFDYIDDFGLGDVKNALRSEIVGRIVEEEKGFWE